MAALKLIQIGNSVGVILPKEALAKLRVDKGDSLHMSESPNGLTLTPYDPAFADQLEIGRDLMRSYRDTFRALAK